MKYRITPNEILSVLSITKWINTRQLSKKLKINKWQMTNPKTKTRLLLDDMYRNGQVDRKGVKKFLYRLPENTINNLPEGEDKPVDYKAEERLMNEINYFLACKKVQMKDDIANIESERNYYKTLAENYKAQLDQNQAKTFLKF